MCVGLVGLWNMNFLFLWLLPMTRSIIWSYGLLDKGFFQGCRGLEPGLTRVYRTNHLLQERMILLPIPCWNPPHAPLSNVKPEKIQLLCIQLPRRPNFFCSTSDTSWCIESNHGTLLGCRKSMHSGLDASWELAPKSSTSLIMF